MSVPTPPVGRLLTAMVTPFFEDGAIDFAAVENLAAQLVADGCDGLCVSGTTGEAPTTSDQEKIDLLKCVRSTVGDKIKLLAGIGGNETAHVIKSAHDAQAAGADGVLAVTPYYNKPPQSGVIAHFEALADATDLPVVLYDIPGRTATAITTDSLLRLAEHDRIVAVKDAKGDIFASTDVMRQTDLMYYCGDDPFNLAYLAHGAVGMISTVGHGFAADYASMITAMDAGDLSTARDIHNRLIPAVQSIMSAQSQGAIRAKAVAHARGLITTTHMRLPLVAESAEQTAQWMTIVEACGLNGITA